MAKTALAWGGGHTLHALGGLDHATGLVAAKTWAHTAGGAEPVLAVWDAETGRLVAMIEAFALGQLRTAAGVGGGDRRDGCAGRVDAGDHRHRQAGASRRSPRRSTAAPIAEVRVFSPTVDASRGVRRTAPPARGHGRVRRRAAIADGRHRDHRHPRPPAGAAQRPRRVRWSSPSGRSLPNAPSSTVTSPRPRALVVSDSPDTAVAARRTSSTGPTEVVPLSAVVAGGVTVPGAGHRRVQGDGSRPGRPRRRRGGAPPGQRDAASRSPIAGALRHDGSHEASPSPTSPAGHRRASRTTGRRSSSAPRRSTPRSTGWRRRCRRRPTGGGPRCSPTPARRPSTPRSPPASGCALNVLLPGERTAPVRHNSTMVGFGAARQRPRRRSATRRTRSAATTAGTIRRGARTSTVNDGDEPFVWLTYSNAPLLEKMNVHLVEETGRDAARRRSPPTSPASPNRVSPFGTFELADGAYLMPYETLINPPSLPSPALHWPWTDVKEHLDQLEDARRHVRRAPPVPDVQPAHRADQRHDAVVLRHHHDPPAGDRRPPAPPRLGGDQLLLPRVRVEPRGRSALRVGRRRPDAHRARVDDPPPRRPTKTTGCTS